MSNSTHSPSRAADAQDPGIHSLCHYLLVILGAAALAAGTGVPLPAQAAPPTSAANKSAQVSVADLDLSTVAGMKAARERLHQNARRLCGRVVNPWSLSHQPDYVRCVDVTTAAAVAKLEGPLWLANARTHAMGTPVR